MPLTDPDVGDGARRGVRGLHDAASEVIVISSVYAASAACC